MAFVHDDVLDQGLRVLLGAERLDICRALPRSLLQTMDHSLGHRIAPRIDGPGPRPGGGRQVVIAAIDDGQVTRTSEAAAFWALSGGGRLLAADRIAETSYVAAGGRFTLRQFVLGFPAAKGD